LEGDRFLFPCGTGVAIQAVVRGKLDAAGLLGLAGKLAKDNVIVMPGSARPRALAAVPPHVLHRPVPTRRKPALEPLCVRGEFHSADADLAKAEREAGGLHVGGELRKLAFVEIGHEAPRGFVLPSV